MWSLSTGKGPLAMGLLELASGARFVPSAFERLRLDFGPIELPFVDKYFEKLYIWRSLWYETRVILPTDKKNILKKMRSFFQWYKYSNVRKTLSRKGQFMCSVLLGILIIILSCDAVAPS